MRCEIENILEAAGYNALARIYVLKVAEAQDVNVACLVVDKNM